MKVNAIITKQIIDNLETSGKWVKHWQDLNNINIKSKQAYRGINTLLLAMSKERNKFESNIWLTFNQATELGGNVKGQKSTMIIFYLGEWKKKDDEGETEIIKMPVLRYYRVFNLDQVSGVEYDESRQGEDNQVIPKASKLAADYMTREKIKLNDGIGNQASYSVLMDQIDMPDFKTFETSDSYYKTLFHEITHSTGSKNRLDRGINGKQGDKTDYSKEELIAELGSLFLSGYTGLKADIKNSTAYIKTWVRTLKNDPQMIISASSKAQSAFDFVIK